MGSCQKIKQAFIETVILLFILLFVYAALNKILDFENFQVQLGQSPLLSSFAGPTSYLVPAVELFIVIFLLIPRLRFKGLIASFSLMVMFTAYIFIMLNFSPFVPCSCGGILEKFSWNEHLFFNIAFTLLAVVALLFYKDPRSIKIFTMKLRFASLAALLVSSAAFVTALFLLSEDTIHHRNNFTRRFPKHPALFKAGIALPFDSYYLAGYGNGNIYLGNRTAPLLVTVIDTALKTKSEFRINLPKNKFPFSAPRLKVVPPYFYFTDGTVPCIFSGSISDWKAELKLYKNAYFSIIEPGADGTAIIRAISSKTKERVLGTINLNIQNKARLNHDLLKKQIDGVFDTDGILLYNHQLDTVLYTYYYRNEFLKIDQQLHTYKTGHTIDTVTRANIQVVKIQSKGTTTLAKEPLLVNKNAATYGNYLFIYAALIGKHEPEERWQRASIIDVYDLSQNIYSFSFYISNKEGNKISEFMIYNDLVISLAEKHLRLHKIKTSYYKPWPEKK